MSKIVGGWNVNVAVGKMPEQVATAFGQVTEKLLGTTYTPIAYLGSQPVVGTNHAVLAEQLITTGIDTKNIVLVVLNEQPGSISDKGFALKSIDSIVDGGAKFGGVNINVQTEFNDEIKAVIEKAFDLFVGSKVEPFALLGTKVTRGIEYKFAATVTPVVKGAQSSVKIVTINGLSNEVTFESVL